MVKQLHLPVQLPDEATFDTFVAGENIQVIESLNSYPFQLNTEVPLVYLSGDAGAGKSHLLYAVCHLTHKLDVQSFYVNFADIDNLHPSMLEGVEQYSAVCLDDIHLISTNEKWQIAVFDLINKMIEIGTGVIIVTGNAGSKNIAFSLPDLASRLSWGVSYHLTALGDDSAILAIQKHADVLGLSMSYDVAKYFYHHSQRDMHSLMANLRKLDGMSLELKRKLTIPFIKDALGF